MTSALPPGFTLLQVTPRLAGGGVEAVTLDIARAVAEAGGRSLVASRGGGLEGRLASDGATLVRMPVDSKNPLVLAANGVRLARLIRREAVSLVHVRSRAPAFSALWAARAAGVPILATYHGIYAAASPLKRWYNGIMTRGDLAIANSDFTRRHILEQHHIDPRRVAVVPEGIDTSRFDPAKVPAATVAAQREAWGVEAQTPVILQAARLTGWKGQTVMIAALAKLDPARGAVLVLAGRPQNPGALADLRAAARAVGVASQVRFVGPLDDMPAAYLAADLAVAPSTAPESFGRGVAEACAMARLVLASPLGATAETVADGETGWLVPAGDAAAWARAVGEALDLSPEARREIGERARARIKAAYSLEAMTGASFALYRRVIEARR